MWSHKINLLLKLLLLLLFKFNTDNSFSITYIHYTIIHTYTYVRSFQHKWTKIINGFNNNRILLLISNNCHWIVQWSYKIRTVILIHIVYCLQTRIIIPKCSYNKLEKIKIKNNCNNSMATSQKGYLKTNLCTSCRHQWAAPRLYYRTSAFLLYIICRRARNENVRLYTYTLV